MDLFLHPVSHQYSPCSRNAYPNEVHDLIISGIAPTDYPMYRLVNRNFAQASIPHLFEVLQFPTLVSSLEDLAHIAESEHLRRAVKSIHWCGKRYRQTGRYDKKDRRRYARSLDKPDVTEVDEICGTSAGCHDKMTRESSLRKNGVY